MTISLYYISGDDFSKQVAIDSISVFGFFILQLLGVHYYNDIVGSLSSFYTDLSSTGNTIGYKINSWNSISLCIILQIQFHFKSY
jgi:hypothetical protein